MAFEPNVQVLVDAISKLSDADKVAYSETIFTDLTQGSDITKYHDIETGVQANDPIPFMDRGEDWEYMKDASGKTSNCDDLPCDVSATLSTKTWSPAPYQCTLEYCFDDLNKVMLNYFNSVKDLEGFNGDTFYQSFLLDLIEQRMINSHWVKTYFAATTGTSTALTGHDGLFVQYAAAAPTSNTDQRIQIAKNAGASYAAQALTAQEGFDIVNELYEKIEDSRSLQSREDVTIQVTRTIAKAYLTWLREQKVVSCCERDPLTGIYTYDNLSIFGRKVEYVREWDYIINAIGDFNTGTAWVNPHRAVASYKVNNPIGTGDAGKLSNLKVKYDDYTEKTKIDAKYTFDVKVLKDADFILAM